jgi:hypothetical protein
MKVAIVGASVLDTEYAEIKRYCEKLINGLLEKYGENLTIISGGATGVDDIAEKIAKRKGIKTKIFHPQVNRWYDAGNKIGFKSRNLMIATECDALICIPKRTQSKSCYHCHAITHEVTGGCWTAKIAKKLGKNVKIVEPYERK